VALGQAGADDAGCRHCGPTVNNAEVLGMAEQVGSLQKGKFADLVASPGDPLADITELRV